jgi:sugar lactone lactonase YvrE
MKPLVDSACRLGEGPLWDQRAGLLRWVDIEGCRIWSHDPATGLTQSVEVGQPVGALLPSAEGGFLAAARDGVATFEPATGALGPLAAFPNGDRRRSNDAKCDRQGRLWVGVMHEETKAGSGSLFCLDSGAGLRSVREGLTLPNGLDWSLDGTTMYFVDTLTFGVDAYPFDPASGSLGPAARLFDVPESEGLVDGLTVDSEGCIWIALCFGGAVRRYTPGGECIATYELPVSMPTSCCFGGPDMRTLFVTSATTGLSAEEMAREPGAGGVFSFRPGVTGLPASSYVGADRSSAAG